MTSLKDSIRNLTVGRKAEYRTIEIDYEGQKVVFKQPSQKVRRELFEKSTNGEKVDLVALQVWTVIALTHDSDGNKVFDDTDFDAIMNQPAGGFVDTFSEKALELLGNGGQENS